MDGPKRRNATPGRQFNLLKKTGQLFRSVSPLHLFSWSGHRKALCVRQTLLPICSPSTRGEPTGEDKVWMRGGSCREFHRCMHGAKGSCSRSSLVLESGSLLHNDYAMCKRNMNGLRRADPGAAGGGSTCGSCAGGSVCGSEGPQLQLNHQLCRQRPDCAAVAALNPGSRTASH